MVLLEQAQEALEDGDWTSAREAFEAALEQEETAEALSGLGNALWWLGETEAAVRSQERAYAAFRRRPDPAQAVNSAVHLCLLYSASLGNFAASRGWLARAARLVEEFDVAPLGGWVQLCRAVAAHDGDDLAAAERWAREARETARRSGDVDLELCALSELGAALVETGRVQEGVALSDEAMAGALGGEAESLDSVVMTCCLTVTSCSRAGEIKRAAQWFRAADDFNRRYGSPHLYTSCRVHYGSILLATGRWEEAERELRAALEVARAAEPALHAQVLAKLAELRLAEGRVEEAARLVAGFEDHADAAYAVAALHLARGETAVAAALLRRRLREVGADCLSGAALLELLAEAGGGTPELAASAERLAALDCDAIAARAERALGRMLAGDAAIERLERALAAFGRLEMPLEVGRTHLLLAAALAGGEREAAIAEARAALAGFEALGAARDADAAAALLRSLGVRAARAGPRGAGVLTSREREVLALLGDGLSNRDIAERLVISRKTVEHHVAAVLSKLGLRSRGEAAGYAVRHLERGRAAE